MTTRRTFLSAVASAVAALTFGRFGRRAAAAVPGGPVERVLLEGEALVERCRGYGPTSVSFRYIGWPDDTAATRFAEYITADPATPEGREAVELLAGRMAERMVHECPCVGRGEYVVYLARIVAQRFAGQWVIHSELNGRAIRGGPLCEWPGEFADAYLRRSHQLSKEITAKFGR